MNMGKTEINTYNHLTVYVIEKWIDDRMEYLRKEVREYHGFKDFAHMDTNTLYRFGRKITELEVLKDMKSDLGGRDLMYECNKTSNGKYFCAPLKEESE